MPIEIEYVIDANGRFWREKTERVEIDPGPQLAEQMAANINIKIPNFFEIKNYGRVGLCYSNRDKSNWWTIPVQSINLRCLFENVEQAKQNYLVPNFNFAKRDVNAAKSIISIPWQVAGDSYGNMPRIVLLIASGWEPGSEQSYCGYQYLYAMDGENRAYRLPMSNLFDTCQICTGDFNSYADNHQGSLHKALNQFETSSWNADLYHSSEAKTKKFFRLRPLEKGFESLPIEGKWQDHCEKISTPQLQFVTP